MLPNNFTFYVLGVYALVISAEVIYSGRKQLHLYNWKDALSSIFLGTLGIVFRTLSKGLWLGVWYALYNIAPFHIPQSALSWVLVFIGNEFVYYWFHRLSHEWRPMWAIHVNHHSSEHMNFGTACRTPPLNFVFHNIFWLPLPLMGFHPEMIFVVEILSFSFTFFQHTTLFPKNRWLDGWLNTPTHHRVHHASNPEYINRNYGNVLIVFDKLFGTFTPETTPPKYGITKNIKTYNPVKIIFHEWVNIWRDWKNRKQKPFRLRNWDSAV